jgi:methanol--5-hydroxybenzimidazolylcobamide Co-methyltransferase
MTIECTVSRPELAIAELNDFVFGRCPKPVTCGRGLKIGDGTVIPEINFTLPAIEVNETTWPLVRKQYREIIASVCRRAVELEVPGLLVELETLPPMTLHPAWGAEITRILADTLVDCHARHGLKNALRLTPNDTRDHERPPLMRRGRYWDAMVDLFRAAGPSGADLLAIESTGGKELCDHALMMGDLHAVVFALGVAGARDMAFLWKTIVDICRDTGVVPSGDTACGFANTAMVLAEQKLISRAFAAVVRVASVPRSLVAYEMGAVGPGKDCGYENPYLKAIRGIPISMEGRTAACAHSSPVGNIAQAVCDCWSNESVQNVRLLGGDAPTVFLEELAYDCRLMNTAGATPSGARTMRDWLTSSDSPRDPQAYVLSPDVVLRLAARIMEEDTPYRRTAVAVRETLAELRNAHRNGTLNLDEREIPWLDIMAGQIEELPENEDCFVEQMLAQTDPAIFRAGEYGW